MNELKNNGSAAGRYTKKAKLNLFQERCIDALWSGSNTLIVAPSSAGKTFAVEQYLFEYIEENFNRFLRAPKRMKIAILFPYKSLAIKEYVKISKILDNKGIITLLTVGGVDISQDEIVNSNIFVGTYEKFLGIIKHYPLLLQYLEILIIDEFHFIGTERGSDIEELIMLTTKANSLTQLVLLSSSISHPEHLAEWLNCNLIVDNYRPVPLNYRIEEATNPFKKLEEIVWENKQTIVFVNSRSNAQKMAINFVKRSKQLKDQMIDFDEYLWSLVESDKEIENLLENVYFDPTLQELIRKGVAYHHAGLSDIIRALIENLFMEGKIDVLFSTSTLAAGINLPASASIYLIDNKKASLEPNLIFQILGRAGRLGLRNKGVGIILVKPPLSSENISKQLFTKNGKPIFSEIKSQFGSYDHLILYFLERIVFQDKPYSIEPKNLINTIKNSLWYFENKDKIVSEGKGSNTEQEWMSLFSHYYNETNLDNIIDFYAKFDEISAETEKEKLSSNSLMSIYSIETGEYSLDFVVKEGTKMHKCTFSPIKRTCTCQNKHSNFLCKHQRFIVSQYPPLIKEQLITYYGIIDFLVNNGFIIRSRGNVVNPTHIGYLSAKYFIHPYAFLDYLNMLSTKPDINFYSFIYQVLLRDKRLRAVLKANELSTSEALTLIKELDKNSCSIQELTTKFNISDSFIEDLMYEISKYKRLLKELKQIIGTNNSSEAEDPVTEMNLYFSDKNSLNQDIAS